MCLNLDFRQISHRFTRDFTTTDKKKIKKNQNLIESDAQNYFKRNPLKGSLAPLLKYFFFSVIRMPLTVALPWMLPLGVAKWNWANLAPLKRREIVATPLPFPVGFFCHHVLVSIDTYVSLLYIHTKKIKINRSAT